MNASVTINKLLAMKKSGEKITCLTAYDASFARLMEDAGVEIILVGDSLGNVIQGHTTTVPVSMDDMVYHSAAVSRAVQTPLLIADLPFMSYMDNASAARNAARLMARGGVGMIKLEGAGPYVDTVAFLSERGIPVCAHLGLTPQTVHRLGGFRVQGRDQDQAQRIHRDALALQDAGAQVLVLECIPAELAGAISREVEIPVIGIGAGADTDGQVLVTYDMLGISPGRPPRFVRNFMPGASSVQDALQRFVAAVKDGTFPAPEHCYS